MGLGYRIWPWGGAHLLIAIVLSFVFNLSLASNANVAFAGLKGQEWHLYLAKQSPPRDAEIVKGLPSPRSFSWNPVKNTVAYIDIDGQLNLYDLINDTNKTLLESARGDQYTQPYFDIQNDRLWFVRMPSGKSRTTSIASIDLESGATDFVVRKRTAQFEPLSKDGEYLYYTTAICVDDCGKPIWELWRKNLQTLEQEQLTLLNALSRKPFLALDNTLYFSSNKNSTFQIWRMEAAVGGTPEPVTTPGYNDTDPNVKAGILYFIRASGGKSQLMMLKDGKELSLPLPQGVTQIRNLEVR